MSIYINAHYPLKNGGRKAITGPMTLSPLASFCSLKKNVPYFYGDSNTCDALRDMFDDDEKFAAVIDKDMKYYIDLENIVSATLRVTPDNIYAIEVYAGGDWQAPAIFYIYQSPKGFRIYVPLKGNTINPKTKAAFGEDEDEDAEYLLKEYKLGHILDEYDDPLNTDPSFLEKVDDPNDIDSILNALDYTSELTPNTDLCFKEFCSRVEPA